MNVGTECANGDAGLMWVEIFDDLVDFGLLGGTRKKNGLGLG